MFEDVFKVWLVNGSVTAIVTLTDVREVVAIVLGVASIISTCVIIYNNLRRGKNK